MHLSCIPRFVHYHSPTASCPPLTLLQQTELSSDELVLAMAVHYGLHTFFRGVGISEERLAQYAEAYTKLRASAVENGRLLEFWLDKDLRKLAWKLQVRVFSSSTTMVC